MSEELLIGNPKEWERFVETHSMLVDELPRLVDLANSIFDRHWTGNNRENLQVFNLGMIVFDCFEDIFCLAANGRGFGARKILRAMYEHLVTMVYIHKHPEQALPFLEYEKIRFYKLTQQIETTKPGTFTAEQVAERLAARDEVRPRFQRPCTFGKHCTETIDMHSWNELGIPALAYAAGEDLADDLVVSYFTPLTETHPTLSGILARQTETPEGGLTARNSSEASRQTGDAVLLTAHRYILLNFRIQLEHFAALENLAPELQARIAEHNRIATHWNTIRPE